MEYFYKSSWFFRYLLIRWFFGSFGFPGYIGRPLYLKGILGARFGRRVRIFPNSRIEIFPGAVLDVHDDVAIAQGFHVTCKGHLVINSGVCIAANVCITDIKHSFKKVAGANILAQEDEVIKTSIGKNCFIGYGAVIDAGTVLGEGCIVGANAYVKGEYEAYSVIASAPATVKYRYQE
ncbi:acyltransferase [Thalassolituus oleivorans]|uniref:Lipopolysaccharide biosynthesis O-acetyl transferase n=1 Tax=Thalassolituus oleivorans MIL-1 TaxID=1298593 RepID=M5DUQ0_9GAMM|nr:DapH/DapD/GlmU-related protein [Thalassolituus oleivorans]CCU72968.1 lipopolysaccharide biosynthesis O-acetyl transferase [Thalassolituus oleivorans MIL-1]